MTNQKSKTPPLVWIDCEMTGLDSQNDHIIEICCLLTDRDLKLIEPNGYESVIHYSSNVMSNMNEWCITHHGDSGLTQKVLTSSKTLADVRTELLSYLEKYIGTRGIGVMAGNSIHQDRMFLAREFPEVIDYLDHRIVDVSSFKEVLKRHNPHLCKLVPKKAQKHTARADILESIDELKWYMNHYLIGRNIQ